MHLSMLLAKTLTENMTLLKDFRIVQQHPQLVDHMLHDTAASHRLKQSRSNRKQNG